MGGLFCSRLGLIVLLRLWIGFYRRSFVSSASEACAADTLIAALRFLLEVRSDRHQRIHKV